MNISDEMKREAAEAVSGKTPAQRAKIAKRYGVHPQTLYVWRRKYIPEAAAEDEPAVGPGYSSTASAHLAAISKPNGTPRRGVAAGKVAVRLFQVMSEVQAACDNLDPDDALLIIDYVRARLITKGDK